MTLEEALAGKEIPEEIKKNLTLVTVKFFSFDREAREGQLVIHQDLAQDVQEIFNTLLEMQFPIQKMVPVVAYGWNDEASMQDNNTSCFNYRAVYKSERISNHSLGRAVDINPWLNPQVLASGEVIPHGAYYDPTRQGAVTAEIADLFKSYGWVWGGEWTTTKDWQHFQKLEKNV